MSPDDLRWVLDTSLIDDSVNRFWKMQHRDDLDWAAAQALLLAGAFTTPDTGSRIDSEVLHARATFKTYVLTSTYSLRLRELRDLRALKRAIDA